MAAYRSSFPTRASMGRCARWYPNGVRMGVLLAITIACSCKTGFGGRDERELGTYSRTRGTRGR